MAPERTWRLLGFWEEKPRTTKRGAHVRVGENDSRREDAAGAGARRSGVNDPLPPEETERGKVSYSNLQKELWGHFTSGQPQYPRQYENEINLALSEAWAWLQAQGLIIPDMENGQYGWLVLSRRARAMESSADFKNFKVANLLPKEILDPKIADPVLLAFIRGEFDVAAFQAMKAVEASVRAACRLGNNLIGVKLMREAFAPDGGALTDMNAEGGERIGRMELFAGAIAS